MEVKQQHSGLATPPALVSPLPIKTSMSPPTHSSDSRWKVVGSPPRHPLLSSPEFVPASDQQATPATPSPSSSRPPAEDFREPVLHTLNNTNIPNGNLSSGPLDIKSSNFSDQSGSIRNTGNELDSPLSLSSFIWNGVVAEDTPGQVDKMRAGSLGGISAGLYEAEDPQSGLFSLSSVLHAEPFIPARERPDGPRSLPSQEHFPVQQFPSLSHHPDNNFSLGGASRGNNDYSLDFAAGSGTIGSTGASAFRMPLQTMHEMDAFEPRVSRMRSHSTSATFGSRTLYGGLLDSAFEHAEATDPFIRSTMSFSSSVDGAASQDRYRGLNGNMTSGAVWTAPSEVQPAYGSMTRNHQRSFTSSSHISPIWETPSAYLQHLQDNSSSEQEVLERQRVLRRYSLAPSSGHQSYDRFLESDRFGTLGEGNNSQTFQHGGSRYTPENDQAQIQRRHSVAVPTGSYARHGASVLGHLEASLESMTLNSDHHMNNMDSEDYRRNTSDLGKGLTLSQVSHHGTLYMVEFKAGRKDLFYVADNSGLSLKRGDLVIVEADRGKDLGKITNDSITPTQVQALAREYTESATAAAAAVSISGQQESTQRTPKEIHPKRIFRTAYTSEIAQLVNKSYDENKALITCQSKVRQKKLQMEVVDAEYQWDRRKLTFYFISDSRIDFRELVRDLFKMYKTRIWMCAVNSSGQREHERSEGGSSPPRSMMSSPKALHSTPYRFDGPTNVQMPFTMSTPHRQQYTMPAQSTQLPTMQHQRAYSDQSFLYRQQSQQEQAPSWPLYYTHQQQQHGRRLGGDTPLQHENMFHNGHEGFDSRLFEDEFPRLGHYD